MYNANGVIYERTSVPIEHSVREIIKSPAKSEFGFTEYSDRERRVAEKNPLVFTPKTYEGTNPFQKAQIDVGNYLGQAKTNFFNAVSREKINTERATENNLPVNKTERGALIFKGYLLGAVSGVFNLGTTISAINDKKELSQKDLAYVGKVDTSTEIISSPIKAYDQVIKSNKQTQEPVVAQQSKSRFEKNPITKNANIINLSNDIQKFRSATKENWITAKEAFIKSPFEEKGADILFGIATFASPDKLAKGVPVKYTNLRVLDKNAEEFSYAKIVSLGYGKTSVPAFGYYGKGGFFVGKIKDFEKTGVSETGSVSGRSSFEVNELANYTPLRKKLTDPIIKYGEDQGYFVKGEFNQVFEEGKTARDFSTQIDWKKYSRDTVNTKEFELEKGMEGTSFAKNIAISQEKKYVTKNKGSYVWNLIEKGLKTKAGDVDTTAIKEQGLESGELVATSQSKDALKGYAVNSSGNVSYGTIENKIWAENLNGNYETGTAYSAISKESGNKVLENGINVEETPRNMYFSTVNKKLIKEYFGKKENPMILEHKWDMNKMLRWKDIPKEDIEKFNLQATDITNRKERFEVSQDRIMNYAINQDKGYLGATRPYEPNSNSYEFFGWDNSIIKDSTGLKIRNVLSKDSAKVYNPVGNKEEVIDVIGRKINPNKLFYGKKPIDSQITVDLEENSALAKNKSSVLLPKGGFVTKLAQKMKWQGIPTQIEDVMRANSGVLGKNTAKGYRDITPELEKSLFPNNVIARFGMPILHRQKDIVRKYFFAQRESARIANLEGNKELAYRIGKDMNYTFNKYKDIFNWREEIAKVRTEGQPRITIGIEKPSSSSFSKVSSISKNIGPSTSLSLTHNDFERV